MAKREFDFIIFGASGFTGKYTVEEWVKYKAKNGIFSNKHTWAVAGRNEKTLDKMLKDISEITGVNITNTIPKVIANVLDASSLLKMTERCSVLVNCVGPFRFYGENLIKACLATQTNCVDVSGEAQYLIQMQLKYNEEAREKGLYLIGSCGFDSIPADCGATLLQQNFEGDLNCIEMFYEYETNGNAKRINYGTWLSEVHIFANVREWRQLERQLAEEIPLPKRHYKLPWKFPMHYNRNEGSWCVPFPQCDASVVRRSQSYFYQLENTRPVQIETYMKAPFVVCGKAGIIAAFVLGLSRFQYGIRLLEKHPRIFSLGTCTRSGPSRQQAEALEFKFTLVGSGWHNKQNLAVRPEQPPDKKVTVVVSGKNPAYGATGVMLLQATLTILNEPEKLPETGGVYTPGVAFAKTSLIKRLIAEGVKFEIKI